MMERLTLEQVRDAVREMDDALDEHDDAFSVAVTMIAAVNQGHHDIRRLTTFTGYERKHVGAWVNRLRAGGVFIGEPNDPMFAVADWFDDEAGGIAFWLDVGVAQGFLERTPTETTP